MTNTIWDPSRFAAAMAPSASVHDRWVAESLDGEKPAIRLLDLLTAEQVVDEAMREFHFGIDRRAPFRQPGDQAAVCGF